MLAAHPLRIPSAALLAPLALTALVCGAYLSTRQPCPVALLAGAFVLERARPFAGCALALAAAPFVGRAPGAFDPHVAALAGALLAAQLRAVRAPALEPPRRAPLAWAAGLLAITLASLAPRVVPALAAAGVDAQELVQGSLAVTVTSPQHALYACLLLGLWIGLAALIAARASADGVARLLRAVLLAHAATLALGLADHLGLISLAWYRPRSSVIELSSFPHRLVALFWHPSWYAQWLALMLPLALGCAWRARGTARAGLMVLAGATAASLPVTYQRGGWIAAAAGTVVVGVAWLHRAGAAGVRRRGRTIAVWCACVALAAFALMSASGEAARVSARASAVRDISGREVLWKGALAIWAERPWLGHGHDTFGWIYPQRYPRGHPDFYGQNGTAHNGWLQLGTGDGLLGVLAFAGLALSVLGTAWRTVRRAVSPHAPLAAACGAAIVAYLVSSLVQELFHVPALATVFWVLVGALGALDE